MVGAVRGLLITGNTPLLPADIPVIALGAIIFGIAAWTFKKSVK